MEVRKSGGDPTFVNALVTGEVAPIEADIRETAEIVRRLSDEAKGALGATGAEHEAG